MKSVDSPIAKLLVLVVVMMAPLVSRGDIITTFGNSNQPNEQNVFFNAVQSGGTVFGLTSLTNNQVRFTSFTDMLATDPTHQSLLMGAFPGSLINQVAISVPGMSFANLVLDPMMLFANNAFIGPMDLTVTLKTTTGIYTYNLPITDPRDTGNHVITFVAADGSLINEVDLASTSGFSSLARIGLGGLVSSTPEPASFLLLGLGLTWLPIALRRRSS
jgi:hypothetical protein